jgi:hypothetical protein
VTRKHRRTDKRLVNLEGRRPTSVLASTAAAAVALYLSNMALVLEGDDYLDADFPYHRQLARPGLTLTSLHLCFADLEDVSLTSDMRPLTTDYVEAAALVVHIVHPASRVHYC